jgi:UDP-glucose 4-epimerase
MPTDKQWISLMDEVITGDIRAERFLEKLAQNRYDTIIHLVSLDHYQSNSGTPIAVAPINIIPTWSLLNIFSKQGLKEFVYFSTIHVYGPLSGEIVDETNTPHPANPYALTHLLSEQICEYYNRNSSVNCKVVRLSNSYGAPIFMENNCWWLAINDICRMAYEKKEIVLQSDGTPVRDFIHGWDVCRAVEFILKSKTNTNNNIFHISSGQTLSISEIAERVKRVYSERYEKEIAVKTAPSNGSIVQKYRIDNTKLKKIGYEAEWDIDKGINDLFSYLEKQ